jgi:hypothetical protein
MTIPGIGPIIASAMEATIGDGSVSCRKIKYERSDDAGRRGRASLRY